MMPIVHGLQEQFGSKVDFLYLDVQDSRTASARSQLGFLGTPHLFLLDAEGHAVREWRGITADSVLFAALDSVASGVERSVRLGIER